jgi:hypothetical protein
MTQPLDDLADQAEDDDIDVIDAADWIDVEPPPPDQVIKDTLDMGDKMVVIGSSKQRKSFFLLQMALSIASGRTFLDWEIPNERRVLYVQYEIRVFHQWRRVFRLAKAMGIHPNQIRDHLKIISVRGKRRWSGIDGVTRIKGKAAEYGSEVIMIDPLYKIMDGEENRAGDFKLTLSAFDEMAEDTGAAIIFIHHDKKGSAGDSETVDRGAGSGVLGRDYDASIILTAHGKEEEATVIEVMVRNYPPQTMHTVRWCGGEGGYRFNLAEDIAPDKKTSRSPRPNTALEEYLPAAQEIIGRSEMVLGVFKSALKEKTGLSDHRIRDFVNIYINGEDARIATTENRGGKGGGTMKLIKWKG